MTVLLENSENQKTRPAGRRAVYWEEQLLKINDPEVQAIFDAASSPEAIIRAGKLAELYNTFFGTKTSAVLFSEDRASLEQK